MTEKLGANQKIGIMFCAMVSAVATGYVPGYINLYYTDTVGISMGAVAMILMITKITDGVTDIIMGMIVDRTNTRLGKARPWVLAGGIGIGVSIMLLFSCPASLSTSCKGGILCRYVFSCQSILRNYGKCFLWNAKQPFDCRF